MVRYIRNDGVIRFLVRINPITGIHHLPAPEGLGATVVGGETSPRPGVPRVRAQDERIFTVASSRSDGSEKETPLTGSNFFIWRSYLEAGFESSRRILNG